ACLDRALVALDHGRDLLALVRVDQEHDFVVTHGVVLVDIGLAAGSAPLHLSGRFRRRGGARFLRPSRRKPAIIAGIRFRKQCACADAEWRRAEAPPPYTMSASVVKLSPQPHSALAFGL